MLKEKVVMKLKSYASKDYSTMELTYSQREEVAKWLNVELDYSISESELNRRIQKAYDEFNRSAYNNGQNEERHRASNRIEIDDEGNETDILNLIPDYRQEEDFENQFNDNDFIQKIKVAIGDNDEWVNICISKFINDESIKEYAARTNQDPNAVSHKYRRALKKIKDFYK